MKKQITFLVLILMIIILSGCNQKIQLEENTSDISEPKTSTTETKEYEIISKNNDWITFKSNTCDFEISYPKEFNWSHHCEDIKHPQFPTKRLIFISNNDYSNENVYPESPSFDISITDTKDKLGEVSILNGDIEELNILGKEIKVQNIKVNFPIEGPSYLDKIFYVNMDDLNFMVSTRFYFYNEELEDLFYQIINSIKFID